MKAKTLLVIKYIVTGFLYIFTYINKLVPKKKRKILIYNRTATYMNNYALYKYLSENGYLHKYKVVYAMPDVERYVYSELCKKIKLKSFYSYLVTIINFLTSEYIFYDNSNLRIRPSKKQKVINLWHGTPLKKIGFESNYSYMLTKNSLNCFTNILLSNCVQDSIYIKSFNLNHNQILHMGYPRNDLLFSERNNLKKVITNLDQFEKSIIWMTTYRVTNEGVEHTSSENWSQTGIPLLTNEGNLGMINDFLKEKKVLLIIKMHHNNGQNNIKGINYSNIYYLSEEDYLSKNLQMYQILNDTSALITDYSSIYFDYLLLNKPMGFVLEDLEDYKNKNGLYYDNIDKYLPGEHIYNFEGLKKFIYKISENFDDDIDRRKIINDDFNKYDSKGNNMKMLLEYLDIN